MCVQKALTAKNLGLRCKDKVNISFANFGKKFKHALVIKVIPFDIDREAKVLSKVPNRLES